MIKLNGKYGTINQMDNKWLEAVITDPEMSRDTGTRVYFKFEELPQWIKRLEVTETEDGGIGLGDWFA